MTMLAFDVGSKRLGVAISHSGMIAEPLTSVAIDGVAQAAGTMSRQIQEHTAGTVVIGLPVRADGSLTPQGEAIEQLAATLRSEHPSVHIATVDEALTSKEAERLGGRAADHDALAAALILEQYLSEHNRPLS